MKFNKDNIKHISILLTVVETFKDKNSHKFWEVATLELNKEFKDNKTKKEWQTLYKQLYNKKDDIISDRVIRFLSKERTLDEIKSLLDLSDYEIMGFIEKLRIDYGYNIEGKKRDGLYYYKLNNKIRSTDKKLEIFTETETINVMVISDTHLCSKYQQIEYLRQYYYEAKRREIEIVLHAGDISDGYYKSRAGHEYEIFAHGADAQTEYIIENYPKEEGIKTYFITGNHDHTHTKNGGVDIGKIISQSRDDMIYLGPNTGTVIINGCVIKLQHPGGGSSYARSYKLQKFIDAMKGGYKPHVLIQGHFHKAFYMFYRNIHAFSCPSLQAPTSFTEAMGLGNDMGAYFLTIEAEKDGTIKRIIPELVPILTPLEDDYELKKSKTKRLINITTN